MCIRDRINGKQNPADLFTKYLPRDEMIRHMAVLGFRLIDHKGQVLGCKGLVECGNAYHTDPDEASDDLEDDDRWINYLETLFNIVGTHVPSDQFNGEIHIKEADKNILVDQHTPQGHLAPLPQVDSEGGLNEPAQGLKLEDYTTAQSLSLIHI